MRERSKMLSRVLIAGGGTGGHIFPALAIGKALKREFPDLELLYVGALGRMEMEKVPAAGFRIVGLPIVGVPRRKTPVTLLHFVRQWYRSPQPLFATRPRGLYDVQYPQRAQGSLHSNA